MFLTRLALLAFAICVHSRAPDTVDEKAKKIREENAIYKEIFNDPNNPYKHNQRPLDKTKEYSLVMIEVNMFIARAKFYKNIGEVELTLRQEWVDPRLKSRRTTSEETLNLSPETKIWEPDTFFATAEEIRKRKDIRLVRVDPSSGHVMHSERYTLKVPCNRVEAFPMVNQRICKLRIGSYAYTFSDIGYFWRGTGFDTTRAITWNRGPGFYDQFQFKNADPYECHANVSTGDYSCVEVELAFEGPCYESAVYVYVPSMLLLICSWLHFWIHGSWTVPRSLSAGVPFAVFAAAMLFFRKPRVEEVTALETWLLFCVLLSFLSLVEYFVCIFLGVRRRWENDAEKPLLTGRERHEPEKDSSKGAQTLDWISRVLFPAIFIIFTLLYFILYLTVTDYR